MGGFWSKKLWGGPEIVFVEEVRNSVRDASLCSGMEEQSFCDVSGGRSEGFDKGICTGLGDNT